MLFSGSNLDNLLAIVTKPDNIPILMMVGLIGFFSWMALSEGRKNDRLIEEGRREDVLKRMRE